MIGGTVTLCLAPFLAYFALNWQVFFVLLVVLFVFCSCFCSSSCCPRHLVLIFGLLVPHFVHPPQLETMARAGVLQRVRHKQDPVQQQQQQLQLQQPPQQEKPTKQEKIMVQDKEIFEIPQLCEIFVGVWLSRLYCCYFYHLHVWWITWFALLSLSPSLFLPLLFMIFIFLIFYFFIFIFITTIRRTVIQL